VKEYQELEKVSIHDLVCYDKYENKILAYHANGRRKDTLAILQKQCRNAYGWAYHTDLVRQRSIHMKFIRETERESINAVLDSGRQILVFTSFHEFVQYAGKISEPA